LPAAEILAVHLGCSNISAIEVIEADESMALALPAIGISSNFGGNDHTKVAKSLIEQFLIDFGVKIAHEKVGSYILRSLILGSLVDLDGLAIQFDHVHDLYGVVCVLLALEFDEAVALVLVCDFVSRDMHIHDGTALSE
jgi:hypothetical protein